MSKILSHWHLSCCLGRRISLRTGRCNQNHLCQRQARSRSSLATVLCLIDLTDRQELLLQFRMDQQGFSPTANRYFAGQYEEIHQSTSPHSSDVFVASCTDAWSRYSLIAEESELWSMNDGLDTIESDKNRIYFGYSLIVPRTKMSNVVWKNCAVEKVLMSTSNMCSSNIYPFWTFSITFLVVNQMRRCWLVISSMIHFRKGFRCLPLEFLPALMPRFYSICR